MGIESIRARLEGLKTVKEVTDTLTEIGDELTGTRQNSAIDRMPRAGELCLFLCLPVSPHSCSGLSPVPLQHWAEEV